MIQKKIVQKAMQKLPTVLGKGGASKLSSRLANKHFSSGTVDPNAYYRATYRSSINPGASEKGTCNYCLRCNGKVFKGSDILHGDGGTVGHHPNCVCTFTRIDNPNEVIRGTNIGHIGKAGVGKESMPRNYGSSKKIGKTNLSDISKSDLNTLAKKRGFKMKKKATITDWAKALNRS